MGYLLPTHYRSERSTVISPFFHNLRTAYSAEIDDLTYDSEGNNVLQKRLQQRRKELHFLLGVLEPSPEMVAVVFHQAFRFQSTAAMQNLLRQEPEDLPEWSSVADTIELAPWAGEMASAVLKQPQGEWFMSVAAALEYMQHSVGDPHTSNHEDNYDEAPESEDDEEAEARARDEAGADWMVEQGFDRKD
jgi:hypothetical protein